MGLAPGQNQPRQCARQAFEIIGAYPRVWGIKIIPRLFAREREAQCPGLKGWVPHGSANWLRRSDTGISFCRREEGGGGGGGRKGGWKGGGRWEVCVHAVVVVLAGVVRVLGVNNSNDFPNLAQSGMWMAALERNWVYLALCLFLYWEETEKKRQRRRRRGWEGAFILSEKSADGGSSEQIILFR